MNLPEYFFDAADHASRSKTRDNALADFQLFGVADEPLTWLLERETIATPQYAQRAERVEFACNAGD
jgi:hypothetical protein